MSAPVRRHLRDNAVGYVAVFLALTGTAWALERNSVRSKHIADGQVKAADVDPAVLAADEGGPPSGPAGGSLAGTYPDPYLKPDAVGSREIVNESVSGVDIKPGGIHSDQIDTDEVRSYHVVDDVLTGADIDETSLAGLQRGSGEAVLGHRLTPGVPQLEYLTVLSVPGVGELRGWCDSRVGAIAHLNWKNESGATQYVSSFQVEDAVGPEHNAGSEYAPRSDVFDLASASSQYVNQTNGDERIELFVAERFPQRDDAFGYARITVLAKASSANNACRWWADGTAS